MTTQDDKNQKLTTKELIPSFWLSQLLLLVLGIGFVWLFYLRRGEALTLFFSIDNLSGIGLGGTLAALLGIALQWGAWKLFTLRAFDDGGINRLLLTLPRVTLLPMFALGAFSEELLVRGVLQTGVVAYLGSLGGVLVTSLIFTGIHFRYLKKPVLICGVFLLSLILGSLYVVTESLWASIWAHFVYNSGAAWLAQKFYLPLIQEESCE